MILMNIMDIERILYRFKNAPHTNDQELKVAREKIEEKIKHNSRLEQFKDMVPLPDEVVIEIISEFFNSGGWDHLEVLKWLKRVPGINIGHEWDHSAAKAVAQLLYEPEKLKEYADGLMKEIV